jgi:hypothetical protein
LRQIFEPLPRGSGFCFTKFHCRWARWREDASEHVPESNPTKSVVFVVTYDDARTAYLWIDAMKTADDWTVGAIARAQQEQGTLPEGNITGIKRVR